MSAPSYGAGYRLRLACAWRRRARAFESPLLTPAAAAPLTVSQVTRCVRAREAEAVTSPPHALLLARQSTVLTATKPLSSRVLMARTIFLIYIVDHCSCGANALSYEMPTSANGMARYAVSTNVTQKILVLLHYQPFSSSILLWLAS